MRIARLLFAFLAALLLLSACAPSKKDTGATPAHSPTAIAPQTPTSTAIAACPIVIASSTCRTPYDFRVAYGVQSLIERGFTGKGQTIVDIVSYGSPTLQQDMDIFDKQFGLPPITIKVIAPLGVARSTNQDMAGWAQETELDVQIIHAVAPGANIVVLTSPVDETEGTIGLPQFLQLEQYALTHHLGNIISQSWGASEVTLKDAAGQQEIHQWDAFLKQATTQQGITFFASSGDNGATDYVDLKATKLSPTPTTSFPADDPWVTSVGGTSLQSNGTAFQEIAWDRSGGGFSSFFTTPAYQQALPASVQNQPLKQRRGVPDVAGDADPRTGLAIYASGWELGGGTSASAPLWAAFMAIADQMAGHPLGFINPALYKLATSSSYAQDFHDITDGKNNVDVNGTLVHGYLAVAGWDPITGLGTPDAEKLLPDLVAAIKG
jgi:subtilase family serine protease